GNVTSLAGSSFGVTDGPALSASFMDPYNLDVDADGNVYVVGVGNRIRKIDSTDNVTTFAGSGKLGRTNGQGAAATFVLPQDLAVDASGNIYVADTGNNLVRKIDPNGNVTTLAGSGSPGHKDGQGVDAS